jgi:hypothetical protein
MNSVWSEELYRIHEMEPGTPISADIAQIGVHSEDIPLVRGDGKGSGSRERL